MKRFKTLKTVLSVLALMAAPAAQAQFLDSSVGVGAGMAKLFGNVSGFTARADVQVLDTNRQETLRSPMNFALLDGKMRMDFDISQMQGRTVQPAAVSFMKKLNLEKVASIIRMDKRTVHVLFPSVRAGVDMEMSPAEAAAAEKGVQVQRTPLGKEAAENHPCQKTRVVVKNAKGASLLEATTWNAEDMKDFPVRIAIQAKEGTTILRFAQVQMARPSALQFEVPTNFVRCASIDTLIVAATQKQIPAAPPGAVATKTPTPATARSAGSTPPVASSPARPVVRTVKPATTPAAPAKTNAVSKANPKPTGVRR